MKISILFAIVALAASASSEDGKIIEQELVVREPSDAGFTDDILPGRVQRIANGASAVDGQFPWATRLAMFVSSNGYVQCSGSLISTNFIISARHCIAE